METKNIIVFGGGGHGKVIADIIEKIPQFKLIGFIDNSLKIGTNIDKYKVLGNRSELKDIIKKESIFGGVIGIGNNNLRANVKNDISRMLKNFNFVNCIHPSAIFPESVKFGHGNVIMAGSVINSSSVIMDHCIINTNSTVEHDCMIDDFSSIGPAAAIGGHVKIGKNSSIGIGANIFNNVVIEENCLIGGGSLVNKNTKKNAVYFGIPAKYIRDHT